MRHENWKCPKCLNTEFEVGELRVAGGALASIFDFENRRFTTVTCLNCRYTEIYGVAADGLEQVFDFLTT